MKSFKLNFLAGEKIILTNLLTGKERTVEVGENGEVNFSIKEAADYLFLKYAKL